MKGERTIFGGDKDAIRRHQEYVTRFNSQLLQRLRQKLAERKADIEAEQDDPAMQRYHATEAYLLQCQVDDIIEREAARQTPKPKRIVVNSRPPRRNRKQPPKA